MRPFTDQERETGVLQFLYLEFPEMSTDYHLGPVTGGEMGKGVGERGQRQGTSNFIVVSTGRNEQSK